MGSWKCIISGLLLAILGLAVSTIGETAEITHKIAWVGEEVDLECGDGGPDSAIRLWEKGDKLISVGNVGLILDDRIHSVNSSAILRIVNVTLEDEGQYTCTINLKRPLKNTIQLHVKEVFCEVPKHPLNGGYVYESASDDSSFKMNDTIRFYCDSGFELIGQALHTCSGTNKGWNAKEPHCEPEYITQLRQRCDIIKINVTDIDNKMTTMMNRVEGVDTRLTAHDNKDTHFYNLMTTKNSNLTLFKIIMSEIDSFTEQLSKDGQLATVGFKDGSLVSQFTWTVKNIEEEIIKAKGNKDHTIVSQSFYTNVPGYRIELRLDPNDRGEGYVGVYVKLVAGEFDNLLLWPFSSRHDFVSVGRYGSQIASFSVKPLTETGCPDAFIKPPTTNTGCGTKQFINPDTLLSNKDQYFIDGALSIQLNVWLTN